MRHKAAVGWLAGCIGVLAALMVGCGGEGEVGPGGDGGPVAPTGTATLTGVVVAANDLQQTFSGAPVSVLEAGRTVNTQAGGSFTIQNLPAGTATVEVVTPTYPDFGSTRVTTELLADETTTLNLAVPPIDAPTPVNIIVDPSVATVDLGGKVLYRSQILGESNQVIEDVEPTWVVTGAVGSVSAAGVFTAQQVGSGKVTAFAGDANRSADVIVVAPRVPQVAAFLVSPTTLPASGGQVYISCALADGDGIAVGDVKAEVFGPGDEITQVDMAVPNPGNALACEGQANCYLEATFAATHTVAANDNQPTAEGIQAPEDYSVRINITDRSGANTLSGFVDLVVQGIDQPPGSPSM
jgi:hypothetical protein